MRQAHNNLSDTEFESIKSEAIESDKRDIQFNQGYVIHLILYPSKKG